MEWGGEGREGAVGIGFQVMVYEEENKGEGERVNKRVAEEGE